MGGIGEADAHTVGKHREEKGDVYSVTCVLLQDRAWNGLPVSAFLCHLIQIGELLLC